MNPSERSDYGDGSLEILPVRWQWGKHGFTLLEVMIAIAIIAIALTTLFGSQSYSLSLAMEAKFNTTATFLAREKLAQYQSGQLRLFEDEGDFGEEFPDYRWATTVTEGEFVEIESLGDLDRPLQRLDLTISYSDELFTYTVTYYDREDEE